MLPEKLYRGDKLKNGTFAELYRTEGLLSKEIHGGNPRYVSINGLLTSVRAHIKPANISEQIFHEKSKFISFTSDYKRAIYFASDGKPEKLRSCKEHYEQRYIFTFDISKIISIDQKNGLYKLEFYCNRKLIKPSALNDIAMIFLRDVPCPQCQINKEPHCIVLVDVVAFLNNNKQSKARENAIQLAKRDFEWLIMPSDYSAKLRGLSSRIPLADIWSVDHFILEGEEYRDPFKDDAVPGTIIDFTETIT
jgi:hypothetical protein